MLLLTNQVQSSKNFCSQH